METKSPRSFYALLCPDGNFDDGLDLIRDWDWDTAQLLHFASKSERDKAVACDSRIMVISAKTAHYIANGDIVGYFRSKGNM